MPEIYARAQMVLVWLGSQYDSYLWVIDMTKARDIDFPASELVAWHRKKGLQACLAKELCSDEYWDRVWIVQEILKARKIQVCFGKLEVTWDAFIQRTEVLSRDNSWHRGALNMERRLQVKYRQGYTFRELFENHQNSVCTEPRDKIYGFVGLAADAGEFPMDYQKSLLEVWKDTMLFAKRQGMLPASDIIRFGKMVKRMLGGSSVASIDQVAQDYASQTSSPDSTCDRTIFNVPGYIAGMIICIGPSPGDIVSSVVDAVRQWKKQIYQNFPADLGDAYRDHDLLMRELSDSTTDDSDVLSFLNLHMHWKSNAKLRYRKKSEEYVQQRASELYELQQAKAPRLGTTKLLAPTSPTSASCLYQMKRITLQNSSWKMGIAAGEVRIGDLLCWIPKVEKAVIIRKSRIVGTAIVPKYLSEQDKAGFRSQYFGLDEEIELGVDVETLYALIS